MGLLNKQWFWFEDPRDVSGVAMVQFFSYNDVEVPGFYQKKGMTSVVDLALSEEELWEKVRKKYSRKPIQDGRKAGVVIEKSDDWKTFVQLYKEFRKGKGLGVENISMFANGELWLAKHDGKVIAGHVFVGNGTQIRSMVAASARFDVQDGKMRRLMGSANRMLIWEAMMWAKSQGYTLFDMGGLGDDGLTEFKESFGGEQKACFYYHKVYSPVLKAWMRLRGYRKV